MEKEGVKGVGWGEEVYCGWEMVWVEIGGRGERKKWIKYGLVGRMGKGGLVVKRGGKEVMKEGEVIEVMEEGGELK